MLVLGYAICDMGCVARWPGNWCPHDCSTIPYPLLHVQLVQEHEHQLAALSAELHTSTMALSDATARLAQLEQEVRASRAAEAQLRDEAACQSTVVEAVEAQLASVTASRDALHVSAQQLQQEVDRLTAQLTAQQEGTSEVPVSHGEGNSGGTAVTPAADDASNDGVVDELREALVTANQTITELRAAAVTNDHHAHVDHAELTVRLCSHVDGLYPEPILLSSGWYSRCAGSSDVPDGGGRYTSGKGWDGGSRRA